MNVTFFSQITKIILIKVILVERAWQTTGGVEVIKLFVQISVEIRNCLSIQCMS